MSVTHSPSPAPISRPAPAKLNLTLQVVGRRDDGYHLLDSLVGFTAYGDTVSVAPATSLSLTVAGPFADALGQDHHDNLVMRAARSLAEAAGIAANAAIHLIKRLPIASGIGGGSSDAAATLLALCALWRIEPGTLDLTRIALALGADVPVCLAAHAARLQGIGDRITRIAPLPPCPIVLVNPGIGLATPAVFKARRGAFSNPNGPDFFQAAPPTTARELAERLSPHPNDLTMAAIEQVPAIAQILERLAALPGARLSRMSGSGATCFGLFDTKQDADAATAILAAHGWWAVATELKT